MWRKCRWVVGTCGGLGCTCYRSGPMCSSSAAGVIPAPTASQVRVSIEQQCETAVFRCAVGYAVKLRSFESSWPTLVWFGSLAQRAPRACANAFGAAARHLVGVRRRPWNRWKALDERSPIPPSPEAVRAVAALRHQVGSLLKEFLRGTKTYSFFYSRDTQPRTRPPSHDWRRRTLTHRYQWC